MHHHYAFVLEQRPGEGAQELLLSLEVTEYPAEALSAMEAILLQQTCALWPQAACLKDAMEGAAGSRELELQLLFKLL